ncbi:MAG: low affinity iron permease family protein [Caulobacter sp.]|nr:low affinity iron permease family protein [Caulobacter sp.]
MNLDKLFTRFANSTSKVAGKPIAFVTCISLVVVWAVSGPLFGFSDTWQLVINTSTTIITFLMVFLIQNTQNRDNAALQAKLDELIRMSDADNSFIGIEHLTDVELEAILKRCEKEARALHAERRKRGKSILARKGAAKDAAPEEVMAAVAREEARERAETPKPKPARKPAARKTGARKKAA